MQSVKKFWAPILFLAILAVCLPAGAQTVQMTAMTIGAATPTSCPFSAQPSRRSLTIYNGDTASLRVALSSAATTAGPYWTVPSGQKIAVPLSAETGGGYGQTIYCYSVAGTATNSIITYESQASGGITGIASASGGGGSTSTPSAKTSVLTLSAATATACPGTNLTSRIGLSIYNGDSATVYVGGDNTVTASTGFPIPAGGYQSYNLSYQSSPAAGQLYCYSVAGTSSGAIRILEIR